jgi:hypothetical protein
MKNLNASNTGPMKTKLFALTLLALCSGCETMPTAPLRPLRTSETFVASKDRVWPLLVSEVGLEYPVRVIEKESGLISTDWVDLPAGFNNMGATQWIFPPGGFLATWDGLRMNMKIMAVETEPGKTQVTVNCHYEAFESNVQKTWLVAQSNGAVENAILSKIERQLLTAPASPEAQKPTAMTAKSPADALMELKKLLDAGAITPVEYDAKKKALMDKL